MKLSLNLIFTLSSLLLVQPSQAENRLLPLDAVPENARPVIEETTQEIVSHLLAALEIATADSDNERNFMVLALELKKFGFGQVGGRPRWFDQWFDMRLAKLRDTLPAEEIARLESGRDREAAAWAKRNAEYSMSELTKLDVNGDLKTDAEELTLAVGGLIAFWVDDSMRTDTNDDNRLDVKEFSLMAVTRADEKIDKDGIAENARHWFEDQDKDGSGYIEPFELAEEYSKEPMRQAQILHFMFLLPGADKDGDGYLTEAEFATISKDAASVWETVSIDGEPIKLATSYPGFSEMEAEVFPILVP